MYTLDDWESLDPREGRRIELIDGRFVVTLAEAVKHQRVGDRLVKIPDDAVFAEGMEAITAVGVRVSEHFGYIPDVVVTTERVETVSVDVANGPVIYCHRLNDGVYSDVVTLKPGNQQPVLVAGTISVTFDPADLHKPRR